MVEFPDLLHIHDGVVRKSHKFIAKAPVPISSSIIILKIDVLWCTYPNHGRELPFDCLSGHFFFVNFYQFVDFRCKSCNQFVVHH